MANFAPGPRGVAKRGQTMCGKSDEYEIPLDWAQTGQTSYVELNRL